MNILTKSELELLMAHQLGPCVSLFMPTHRHLPETAQDPIRFKNLVRAAHEQLQAQGLRLPEIQELLRPAERLLDWSLPRQLAPAEMQSALQPTAEAEPALDETSFWKFQSDGLAMFRSAQLFRCYRLPVRFAEQVFVTSRFHLKPLWQVFSLDQRFFILALSQKSVRLLEGTGYGVTEHALPQLPEEIGDILSQYDFEEQLQFHTRAPAAGGGRAAVFHGQGLGFEDNYKRLLAYLRQIDTGLQETLKDDSAPLVLACVDYLMPLFREVNTYPHLMAEGLSGNPDLSGDESLRQRAWRLLEPTFQHERAAVTAKYHQQIGTGRASAQIAEVVPAAWNGRVDSLFVALGVQQWGRYDLARNEVILHDEPDAGDGDLLDFAALHTLRNGGTVYAVESSEVPGNGSLAAVFRY